MTQINRQNLHVFNMSIWMVLEFFLGLFSTERQLCRYLNILLMINWFLFCNCSFCLCFSCGKQFPNDPRHTQGLELIISVYNYFTYLFAFLSLIENSNSILGGRKAFDPWVVSLGRHEEDDYQHECTGAVVDLSCFSEGAQLFFAPFDLFMCLLQ